MDRVTRAALDDEHKARAAYRAVIERFGQIRPFSNIVESEERHIGAARDAVGTEISTLAPLLGGEAEDGDGQAGQGEGSAADHDP